MFPISFMDIRNLDLNLLVVFDALLDERNVTRAGRRLGLSQPAVSAAINRLREAFADPLFVRAQRGVRPTPRALQLAAQLKAVLAGVESLLEQSDFVAKDAETTFSIAASDYAQEAVLIPLICQLRAQAPGIRLAIRPLDSPRVGDQLERGQLDLALTIPQAAPQRAYRRVLFTEHYVCAMRESHPALHRRLTLKRFCRLDYALVSPTAGAFRGPVDDALQALGAKRRVVLSLSDFATLDRLLRATDLAAVAPHRLFVGRESGLSLYPLPIDVPGFQLIAIWHERTHHSPPHQWLRDLMATVVA